MRAPAIVIGILVLAGGFTIYGGGAATPLQPDEPNPCVGTISQAPNDVTLISIQGSRLTDDGYVKTEARLVAVGGDGTVHWVRDHTAAGRHWTYDVDPLPDGTLLVSTTEPGITVVEVLNASTGDPIDVTRYRNVGDAHDVDLINGDELVFADKKAGQDRIVVYNRTTGSMVWEWRFENHTDRFPKRGGGNYPDDWSHVNDVDEIAPGEFLVSVRNFDQVIVVNRSTDRIDLSLGEDGNQTIMHRQHNPQFLEGPADEPTVLIADSLNDRVVEYTRIDGSWHQSWALVGGGLNEPRDADRLPNGNTLIADRKGHRVIEVTPEGTVVWEFYAPWETYDVERYRLGDEPGGPTAREQGVTGTKTMTGSAGFTTDEIETCDSYLAEFSGSGATGPFDNPTRESSQFPTPLIVILVAVGLGILVAVGVALARNR